MEKRKIKIRTFEDLGKVVTNKNKEDLLKCFCHSLLIFLDAKKTHKDIIFVGMNWIDDGKNEITSIDIQKTGKRK